MAQEPGSRGADIDRELRTIADEIMIDAYKPAFLGEGGEHLVFALPGHPRFVAKVNHEYLAHFITSRTRDGGSFEALTVEERKKIDRALAQNRRVHEDMRRFFGDMTLREFQYVMAVPLTSSVLHTLVDDHLPDLPEGVVHVPASVRLQEKLPDTAMKNGISLTFAYIERSGRISDADYEHLNGIFDGSTDPDEYLRVVLENPDFIDLLHRDERLRTAVRRFVEAAVHYTEETGEMLDLAGTGNALVYKDPEDWRVVLPDAMYPNRDAWSDVRDAVELFLASGSLDQFHANRLMNGLNYARLVHALAQAVGSPARLRISRKPLTGRYAELRNVIRDADRQS